MTTDTLLKFRTCALTLTAIGAALLTMPATAQAQWRECYGCYSTYSGAGYYPPGGYAAGYYRPAFIYPPPAYQLYGAPYHAAASVPYVPVPYVYGFKPRSCGKYDRHCPW